MQKGFVKRGVTRIVTSGTLTESDFLKQNSNNYICALFKDEKSGMWGFSYADISTGEFKVTQASYELIMAELTRISPAEVVGPSIKQKIMPFQIVPDEKIDLPEEITKTITVQKFHLQYLIQILQKIILKPYFRQTVLNLLVMTGIKLVLGLLEPC